MASQRVLLATLVLASCTVLASGACQHFGGVKRTALLVADPGGFTGNAEAGFYLANLKLTHHEPANATVCAGKFFGIIMGLPVVVVTTGIGPITAALCVTELLQCRSHFTEFVYMGTAGASTQKGGVLNADGTVNPSKHVLRLGDVCVSPYAVNWECQLADWTDQCAGYPNVDSYPGYAADVTVDSLYGQCLFTNVIQADIPLTAAIVRAARKAKGSAPIRSSAVYSVETLYYRNLTTGTGIRYPYPKAAIPQVRSFRDGCTEVDGQFFYSGVPWDMSARNFTAIALNLALKTTKFTQKNVIAVAAMESIGVGFAVQNYNKLHRSSKMPYTVVRGMSDFLHAPVVKAKNGGWRQVPQNGDFGTTYAYAIAAGSHTVLSWLQTKCQVAVKMGTVKGPATTTCLYSIKYS